MRVRSRRRAAPRALAALFAGTGPMAFSRFCLRYREDCEIHRLRDASGVTRAHWGEVRGSTPRSTTPSRRKRTTATSSTRLARRPHGRRCHDYAVTKRHELMQLGGRRARCCSPRCHRWGEHHLVLVVRTRTGDSSPTTSIRGAAVVRGALSRVRIQTSKIDVLVDGRGRSDDDRRTSLAARPAKIRRHAGRRRRTEIAAAMHNARRLT